MKSFSLSNEGRCPARMESASIHSGDGDGWRGNRRCFGDDEMTHFPLNTAALCQDCSEVGDSLRRCACCGSRSLIALAPVLNREAPLGAYELEQSLWSVERREEETAPNIGGR